MKQLQDKKILFIITKSNLGGAQKYVYELALEAKNAGGDVAVACGGTGDKNAQMGELSTKLREQHIPTYTIKNFMRDMSLFRDISALIELIVLIHKLKPDVVHVTSSKAGGLGALAGRLCRVQNIIFTSHGLTFQENWRPGYQKTAIKLFTWATLILSHHSIMISKDTFDTASKLPFVQHKIHLIYNGIKPPVLITKKEAQKILAPEIKRQDTVWIGGIGELHPNKNWSLLIKAMKLLPTSVHCIIIGEGQERKKLQEQINMHGLQERVLLAGFVQGAASVLPAFDIFILPSKKEGLPYVLLEAGMAQCTVACSNIPGNADIIQNDINGKLFQDSITSITSVITTLIKDTNLRSTLAHKLHSDVQNKFSKQEMIQNTFAVYNQTSTTLLQ